MRLAFLTVLLLSLLPKALFGQVTTRVAIRCGFFSDSTFSYKIYALKYNDTLLVEKCYHSLKSCLVVHNNRRGHVYYKYLTKTPELIRMMEASQQPEPDDAARSAQRLKNKELLKELMRSRPRNNFYGNIFGDASALSVNYERLVVIGPNLFLAGKVGLGVRFEELLPFALYTYSTFPFHVTANLGRRTHFFEMGTGLTTEAGGPTPKDAGYDPTHEYVIVGYRFQPIKADHLIMFRLNFLRYLHDSEVDQSKYFHLGICVGRTF